MDKLVLKRGANGEVTDWNIEPTEKSNGRATAIRNNNGADMVEVSDAVLTPHDVYQVQLNDLHHARKSMTRANRALRALYAIQPLAREAAAQGLSNDGLSAEWRVAKLYTALNRELVGQFAGALDGLNAAAQEMKYVE